MKFSIMTMGRSMFKTETGFQGKGDWTLYKCFYKETEKSGGDLLYGEFFININEKEEIGEIVYKNKQYGPDLMIALNDELVE